MKQSDHTPVKADKTIEERVFDVVQIKKLNGQLASSARKFSPTFL